MTDWIMIIITAVYVIATIFICVANFKSAKATRDQLAEQKRQFDEINRPYVTVHFEVAISGLYTLCVCNHGKKVAKNVHLEIDDDFIEQLENDNIKQLLNNTKSSKIDIGIEQKWYLWIGVFGDRQTMSKTVGIKLTYQDDQKQYYEEYNIDLTSFNWQLLSSPENRVFEQIKKTASSTEKISKTLMKIERELNKELNNG